ncbi:MAG: hypothetical protein Q8P76_04330 [bacterium]|nr:hypothetical protein [bacterium]
MNFEKNMFRAPDAKEKEKKPQENFERFAELDAMEAPIGGMLNGAFSPDGKFFAGNEGNTVRLFNAQNGKEAFKFESQAGVRDIALRPDGFVVLNEEGNFKIFVGSTAVEYRSFISNSDMTAIATTPDNQVIFACKDQSIKIYDPAEKRSKPLMVAKFPVATMAISPDLILAYANKDGKLEICDPVSLRCSYSLDFKSRVSSLSFTPGGKLLVGLESGLIKILDSKTGNEVKSLEGHSEEVLSVAWTPEGRVKSASKDGSIRTWAER